MIAVYILRCDNRVFYCGITKDLYRRLYEHVSGRSRFTSRFSRIECVFVAYRPNYFEARKLELRIKASTPRRYYMRYKYAP